MSSRFSSDHLFKAGARIARSGGDRRLALRWTSHNDLRGLNRRKVLEGFDTERVQIMLRGGLAASAGRPYGRL